MVSTLWSQALSRHGGAATKPEEQVISHQGIKELLAPAETYVESDPTVHEWVVRTLHVDREIVLSYALALVPASSWLGRYNVRWLIGDVIGGLTIGLVVIPQAMAYALLAGLSPAFGLYTSFTGVVFYWMFGTSKDVVIGYPADTVLGLLRLGWLLEFIPYIPISAFVTAASITIISTQVPKALGIQGISTNAPAYRIIIDTLKQLHGIKLDAAVGITSIVLLSAMQTGCNAAARRWQKHARAWQLVSTLRMALTMLLFTLISFLVNRGLPEDAARFRIVGTIDRGFRRAGVPRANAQLLGLVAPKLPALVIILLVEHIAIAKAMGKKHGYTIVPSQEILASGMANLFSPFVGGYVCTGSFGASAVLSRSGAYTPLAGLSSGLLLVLTLYALTSVFYYIPHAALAGLIIHAVAGLIASPGTLQRYWQLSPIELVIWIVGVTMAIFMSLEISIYVGIGLSLALLLYRTARSPGVFLQTVHAFRWGKNDSSAVRDPTLETDLAGYFVPLEHGEVVNPDALVRSLPPGVFIYRFPEGFNYTNQAQHVDHILRHIVGHSQKGSTEQTADVDRLWNEPRRRTPPGANAQEMHPLRAVVLDMAAVNDLDITSLQALGDLFIALDKHSAPGRCDFHFAHVQSRWTRRALSKAGFGAPPSERGEALADLEPVYNIALLRNPKQPTPAEVESALNVQRPGDSVTCALQEKQASRTGALTSVDRPFFHLSLEDAITSAARSTIRHVGAE